jgi:hypothetical protein
MGDVRVALAVLVIPVLGDVVLESATLGRRRVSAVALSRRTAWALILVLASFLVVRPVAHRLPVVCLIFAVFAVMSSFRSKSGNGWLPTALLWAAHGLLACGISAVILV